MSRLVLVFTLATTTLLGPTWCCCALGSILDSYLGGQASGCCCAAMEMGNSHSPQHAPRECPCKKSRGSAISGERTVLPGFDTVAFTWTLQVESVDSLAWLRDRHEVRTAPREQFLPSGVDLVYALCDMRC
jgi:hypothetical protein